MKPHLILSHGHSESLSHSGTVTDFTVQSPGNVSYAGSFYHGLIIIINYTVHPQSTPILDCFTKQKKKKGYYMQHSLTFYWIFFLSHFTGKSKLKPSLIIK